MPFPDLQALWQRLNARSGGLASDLLILTTLSVAIRLITWWYVSVNNVAPLYDEASYLKNAVAIHDMIIDMLRRHVPAHIDAANAYGGGTWPPLQPALLATGMLLFGKSVAASRLMVTLVSAATTSLVYLLTRRILDRRAARSASVMHVIYVGFVAFSHYLWSETLFIFLMLLTIDLLIRTSRCPSSGPRRRLAVACGLSLGLMAMTRTTALPFMIVIPLWLAFRQRPFTDWIRPAAIIVITSFIVIAPWQMTIFAKEKLAVPLSTKGGFNLYLGNNPWVPAGAGSSWGHASRGLMKEAIAERVERHGVHPDTAARELGLEEIRQEPGKFLVRSFDRFRMIWRSDFFVLRHIFMVVYPPLPPVLGFIAWAAMISSYLAILALATLGFMSPKLGRSPKILIGTLILAYLIPPCLTVSMTRLHLPILALLLPLGSAGIEFIGTGNVRKMQTMIAATVVGIILFFTVSTLPVVLNSYLEPSSHYRGLLTPLATRLGVEIPYRDVITLGLSLDASESRDACIVVKSNCRLLSDTSDKTPLDLPIAVNSASQALILADGDPETSPTLSVQYPRSAQSSQITPVRPEYWHGWSSPGLDGIDCTWFGSYMSLTKVPAR